MLVISALQRLRQEDNKNRLQGETLSLSIPAPQNVYGYTEPHVTSPTVSKTSVIPATRGQWCPVTSQNLGISQ